MNTNLIPIVIENFRQQLNLGIQSVKFAYSNYVNEVEKHENDFPVSFDDFFHDWAQANWELLVERVICDPSERLVEYGAGADYEMDQYSRVFFHTANPTHEISCDADTKILDLISGDFVTLSLFRFDGFVNRRDNWFELDAPFDHILLSEKIATGTSYRQIIIPMSKIEWRVSEI